MAKKLKYEMSFLTRSANKHVKTLCSDDKAYLRNKPPTPQTISLLSSNGIANSRYIAALCRHVELLEARVDFLEQQFIKNSPALKNIAKDIDSKKILQALTPQFKL